ncbi:hypothetical protein B0J13DRAFT_185029 [Dactylonectria estremocensis]|uniref:Uncharacterized protein n=1 Tax=Dactylonectria estremocensis TaxID=1079267 RepID=A0A9P9FC09_9HYPO|nr:hypothetical protein B0J13DRAFT_185029 [Dactylonectria estremocensis]
MTRGHKRSNGSDATDDLLRRLNHGLDDVRGCLDQVRQAIMDLERSYAEIRKGSEASIGQAELLPGVTLDQVQMHTSRLSARLHNSGLRDPSEPIYLVHAYDENGDLELPEVSFYPQSVREFFALRTPTSAYHREMLNYLVAFYDIPLPLLARSPPVEGGELTAEGRNLAIEKLAANLCLLEAGFILYEQLSHEQRVVLVQNALGRSHTVK